MGDYKRHLEKKKCKYILNIIIDMYMYLRKLFLQNFFKNMLDNNYILQEYIFIEDNLRKQKKMFINTEDGSQNTLKSLY